MPFEIKTGAPKPHVTSGNATLNRAFLVKKDEFYTQYEDVAREMVKHRRRLKGKTVFCNCDDPFESAFFRFFVLHFDKLEIKALVTTCFDESSFAGREYPLEGMTGAYKAVVTEVPEISLIRPDGSLDLEPLFAMPENSFRETEIFGLLNAENYLIRRMLSQLTRHLVFFVNSLPS